MIRRRSSLLFPLGLLWLLGAAPGTLARDADAVEETVSKPGIEVLTFGGPNSVGRELEDQARPKEYRFRMLQNLMKPWFAWKQRVHEKHGFTLGFNATVLGQYGDGSAGDPDVAGGGIYRLQAAWTAVGRETGHPGTLSFRFEHRSRIGPLGPSSLSGDLGIATVNSGFAYSDEFGPDLSVINWTQLFASQRAGFVAGRLDFAAYLDPAKNPTESSVWVWSLRARWEI